MIYIYILELCNNKFYIGKLYNIYDLEDTILRLDETIEWLYYNKIIKIASIDSFEDNIDVDINHYVYEFMEYYGVNNVRSDNYYKMKLTFDYAYHLFTKIKIQYNKCYLCGYYGHNGHQCKLKNKYGYNSLVIIIISNIVCFNCNQKGHYKEECKYTISI